MRVQSHIRELLLKRHRWIGRCDWRHASREIEENRTPEIAMARMNPITMSLITSALLFLIRN